MNNKVIKVKDMLETVNKQVKAKNINVNNH